MGETLLNTSWNTSEPHQVTTKWRNSNCTNRWSWPWEHLDENRCSTGVHIHPTSSQYLHWVHHEDCPGVLERKLISLRTTDNKFEMKRKTEDAAPSQHQSSGNWISLEPFSSLQRRWESKKDLSRPFNYEILVSSFISLGNRFQRGF